MTTPTPNTQDILLSDEELRDAISSQIDSQFVASVKSAVSGDTASTDYYLGIVKQNILDLINTQKRLYAESVIGEDLELPKMAYGHNENGNYISGGEIQARVDAVNRKLAEQRARL